jgi:hypothetical protein
MIMFQKTEQANFRHRGFKLVDSSGVDVPGSAVIEVFGNDAAPQPQQSGTTYAVAWDHDVAVSTVVSDHVSA